MDKTLMSGIDIIFRYKLIQMCPLMKTRSRPPNRQLVCCFAAKLSTTPNFGNVLPLQIKVFRTKCGTYGKCGPA